MSTAFPITPDPRFRISTASSNQTVFTVSFPFLGADELTVIKIGLDGLQTVLARPANYNVAGAGNPLGGTVTLKVGAKAGEQILTVGNATRTRGQDVTRGGKYSTDATDQDFDRLTIIAQEHDRDLARAWKVPYGDTPGLIEPGPAATVAMWDADGNLVEGPDSTALEHIDVALAVDAGRALIYPAAPAPAIYDAGSRKIANVSDGTAPQDVSTKAQLDALADLIDSEALTARLDAIEARLDAGWVTGDLKIAVTVDAQAGWLLVNGQTIGNAISGGTARANADTWPLFARLYAAYDNTLLVIQTSAGAPTIRGADAATDFAAGKRLPLPEARGEFLRFLDLGRAIDTDRAVGSLQAQQLLQHGHTATFTGAALPPHGHTISGANAANGGQVTFSGGTGPRSGVTSSDSAGTPTGTVAVANSSGGAENRVRNIAFPLFVKL